MDNMLYIIAGLVLILLIAVLVMRKNKAQKPSARTPIQAGKNLAAKTPVTKSGANQRSTTQQNASSEGKKEGKFDTLSVAQRFIEQQRYDKAIETLNRGLIEKPNDSQLSLKLLGIYATINQTDDFYKVYDGIKSHNDAKSIAQADELKALLVEEQNQVAQHAVAAQDNQNTDFERAQPAVAAQDNQNTDFESLDFDLPASQVDNTPTVHDTVTAEDNAVSLIDTPTEKPVVADDFNDVSPTADNVDDTFDLTLSDLEDDGDEPTTTSTMPVSQADRAEEESPALDDNNATSNIQDDDISDFDFELDLPEQMDSNAEPSVNATITDNAAEDVTLADEDFVLDFADLETDVEADAGQTTNETLIEMPQKTDITPDSEDEFALSLDDIDESVPTDNVLESEKPTLEEDNDLSDFVLEDNDFEDNNFDDNSFENNNSEKLQLDSNTAEGTRSEESSIAPTAPLMFDDNTVIDDDFDFDSLTDAPTAATPVDVEHDVSMVDSELVTNNDVETTEDFSSRFAADFDFVKTLDSNQVTLDLAGQYLQLGEYDSAKRLLNEVMTQGTSEQQQQAQVLLDRTA